MVRVGTAQRPIKIFDDPYRRSTGPAFIGGEELFKKGIQRGGFRNAEGCKSLVLQ